MSGSENNGAQLERHLPLDVELPSHVVRTAIERALEEDLGFMGDITSRATLAVEVQARAILAAREAGVISGLGVAEAVFRTLDPATAFTAAARDGEAVPGGAVLAHVSGKARALLAAERTALNFLGHMSGIATLTRRYVDAVAGTKSRISDTRKTTPGLRALEKYAVRCGGGINHRAGLFDAILIKDNHIAAAGGIGAALAAVRARAGHMVAVEVEVDTLEQLEEALRYDPVAVLLDNMSTAMLREAVALAAGHCITEASGGITLETAAAVAATGVDILSVGALTHSAPRLDVALDFEPA